jgi:hypothetical protein
MYKHQGVNRGAPSPRWVLVMTGNEIGAARGNSCSSAVSGRTGPRDPIATQGEARLLRGALDLMCPWTQFLMPDHAPSNELLHPRPPDVPVSGLPGDLAHG